MTAHKLGLLTEIGRRYQIARRRYEREFYPSARIGEVLAPTNVTVSTRWEGGLVPVDLLTHHHKMAMEDALAIVRGGWEAAFARTATLVRANKRWSDLERRGVQVPIGHPWISGRPSPPIGLVRHV